LPKFSKLRSFLLMQTPRSPHRASRTAFFAGVRDQAPIILGMIPFGMIAGAAPVASGMDPWLAMAMNVIIYAGAAQLATISLMAQHVPMPIVVATALVVNLRFVMYSAALAPYFAKLSTSRKWLFSYLITDHGFALLTAKYKSDDAPELIEGYYGGVTCTMWISWQIAAALGVLVGAQVPPGWSLDFTIPLVFLALVLPSLTTRAHWCAAAAASVMAIFTQSMPLKLGLITAAVVGITVGTILDMRQEKLSASGARQ
jgi:4-azaleucine resistance transporter AzlC